MGIGVFWDTTRRIILSLIAVFTILSNTVHADSVGYFYDSVGRLTRVVKETAGITYTYDAVGNLVSSSSGTLNGAATISGAAPDAFLVGIETDIVITGANLLLTDRITSAAGRFSVKNLMVENGRVTATIKGLTEGSDQLQVYARGSETPLQATVTFLAGGLELLPGYISLLPGQTGSMTATIYPPAAIPLTVGVKSSEPLVASVPSTVTIPAGGTATFTVSANQQQGMANITAAGSPVATTAVFVSKLTGTITAPPSQPVSVAIASAPSFATGISVPLSVAINVTPTTTAASSTPISVQLSAAPGATASSSVPLSIIVRTAPGVAINTSSPVSIQMQLAPGAVTNASPAISVSIESAP